MDQSSKSESNGFEFDTELARVLKSQHLSRSETLRRLLLYLSEQKDNTSINEYAIATDGLGKNHGFDPGTDASVRVHISRLRRKLKEFYVDNNEPELLQIPTGSYNLLFLGQSAVANGEELLSASSEPLGHTTVPSTKSPSFTTLVLSAVIAFLTVALVIAAVTIVRQNRAVAPISAKSVFETPNAFWARFLAGDAPIKIVLPTPVLFKFPDHPSLRLRSTKVSSIEDLNADPEFQRMIAGLGPLQLDQLYIPRWQSIGAFEIMRYLGATGQAKRVGLEVSRESSMLSLEQANLVIFGTGNTLGTLQDYVASMNFRMPPDLSEVTNAHPAAGEPARFLEKVEGPEHRVKPAIVALLPGRTPGLKMLLLISGDTYGVTPLLTSTAGSNAIQKILHEHQDPGFFEMVVMTELEGHTPVRSWPVALHPYVRVPIK